MFNNYQKPSEFDLNAWSLNQVTTLRDFSLLIFCNF